MVSSEDHSTFYVEGDWTNDNDGQTACGQNDCEELNISLYAGPNIIGEHHETGLVKETIQ